MQSRKGFIALFLAATAASLLGACGTTTGTSSNAPQPQQHTVTVYVTSAPTPEDSPSPSPSDTDANSDNTGDTAQPTDDPSPTNSKPIGSLIAPATSCTHAEINPDDCAEVRTWLASKSRNDSYQDVIPSIGLALTRKLLKQKHVLTYDDSGNKFTLDAGFTGWAVVKSSDKKMHVKAYLRGGKIVTKVAITDMTIRNAAHSSNSEVTTTRSGNIWVLTKCSDGAQRKTDLRFFVYYHEPRPVLPNTCGGAAKLVGPGNLGEVQTLDGAITDQLREDTQSNGL